MKTKWILLAFAVIWAFSSGAQTLQFSQVKLITGSDNVPSGKVWKVESVLGNRLQSSCSTAALHTITVAGSVVTVTQSNMLSFSGSCNGWAGIATVTTLPIWLPTGTALAVGSNVSGISVIEFTVVP